MKILIIAFPDVFVTTLEGNADQAICMTLHENTVDFPKLKDNAMNDENKFQDYHVVMYLCVLSICVVWGHLEPI